MSSLSKKLISIVGPTATGKTALAIQIAQHFGKVPIISFDSRQCYRELNIGTSKPSKAQQNKITHYFIDSHSIHDTVTVKDFKAYAENILERLYQEYNIILAVGGTGLFWNALLYGVDDIPNIEASIRHTIREAYQSQGMNWLTDVLLKEDPLFAIHGEMKNPQRMMRALEVIRGTGKSIKTFHKKHQCMNDTFSAINVGIFIDDRNIHKSIIAKRVQFMLDQGLEEEVRQLQPFKEINALNTVGYKEWNAYFDQLLDLKQVKNAIINSTHQYAKKQMTWFKRYPTIKWFSYNTKTANIIEYISQLIKF